MQSPAMNNVVIFLLSLLTSISCGADVLLTLERVHDSTTTTARYCTHVARSCSSALVTASVEFEGVQLDADASHEQLLTLETHAELDALSGSTLSAREYLSRRTTLQSLVGSNVFGTVTRVARHVVGPAFGDFGDAIDLVRFEICISCEFFVLVFVFVFCFCFLFFFVFVFFFVFFLFF